MVERSGEMMLPPNIFAHNRAIVTAQYSVMPPAGVLPSRIPGIEGAVIRILTAPPMGAKFAEIMLELESGGGTTAERDDRAQGVQQFFYLVEGAVELTIDGERHELTAHGYAYVPVGHTYGFTAHESSRLLWLKKPYEAIDLPVPDPIVGHSDAIERTRPHTEGRYWQYLLPADDLAFDMNVNILGFAPGNYFPYVETHIMEHGLYMLEGQGLYLLANQWHEVQVDDFIWMGPYCPQHFYCTGWTDAAYLLYKDVNRDLTF
jgi:(S)-ureidoglycine aminohydrolase